MEIKTYKIEKLKPYKNNAKIHTKEQIEQIKESIEKFGMNDPIAIWGENNIIIEGHGRLQALKQLGYKEVECIRLDHLTNQERKVYTLIHNKLTMNTGFDFEILNKELINIEDINMEEFGFELDFGFEEEKEIIEDEIPQTPKKAKTKIGDIYQLGKHRLICGDSTNVKNIEELLENKQADIVITDPPYEIEFNYSVLKESISNGHIFIFNNDRAIISQLNKSPYKFKKFFVFNHSGCAIPQEGGNECFLDHILISHETVGTPNTRYNKGSGLRTVIKGEYRKSEYHKHEKPQNLLCKLLNCYSQENDIVLDLFGGSGSTLIACEQTNRICKIIELNPLYADIIIKRWENLTKQRAVKIQEGDKNAKT